MEHQAPHRGNRFTVGQRETERQTHKDKEGQTEQPREEKSNNDTDTDKQQHSKRARQDKRTTDC